MTRMNGACGRAKRNDFDEPDQVVCAMLSPLVRPGEFDGMLRA